VRFDSFIFHQCLVRDPVDFPGLTSVIRERLFKVGRVRGDVRPNKSNQDRSAIRARWSRVEKLAASILDPTRKSSNCLVEQPESCTIEI
jgi:hypothetical protein